MSKAVKVTEYENEPAEKALVGGLVFFPEAIPNYLPDISPGLFRSPSARRGFETVKAVYDERGTVELPDVFARGGDALGLYVTEAVEAFTISPDIGHYVALIKGAAAQRRLQGIAADILGGVGAGREPADTIAAANAALAAVAAPYDKLPTLDLDAYRAEVAADPEGWGTGYAELDRIMRLAPGSLNYVVGATGHGKSTFLVNLAVNYLRGYPTEAVLFINLETRGVDLITKFLTTLNGADGLSYNEMRSYFKGILQNPEAEAFAEAAAEELGRYRDRVHLKSGAGLTAADITRLIRAFAKAHGPGLVLLDYVQLVTNGARDRERARYLELGDVSAALRAASIDYSVATVAGVQAGRITERPTINNLRESGNLEMDAATVIGLWSPNGDDEYRGAVDLGVLKNRYGPTKADYKIVLDYRKRQGVMADAAPSQNAKTF